MGAFIIQHKKNANSVFSENHIFMKMGFREGNYYDTKTHHITFYEKTFTKKSQYFTDGNDIIFVVGTLIYKKNNLENSIKYFLADFKAKQLKVETIIGQFSIIIIHNNLINIITDSSGIQNIYYNKSQNTISSSFLAVCNSEDNLILNKFALTENLLTGALIGPESIFSNIYRLENKAQLHVKEIAYSQFKRQVFQVETKTRTRVLNEQIDALDNYFSSIKNTADELGVTLGLTGGFDSRLLMCFAERHFSNIEYFSHWRKNKNLEFKIAEQLAKSVSKNLMSYPVTPPLEMSEKEAWETLEHGFYHCDGHIRSQLYWHESYNNLSYIQKVYQNNTVGLHGVGGEQYRNYERMILPRWNYHSWLKHEILYRYSENVFNSKKEERDFISWYSDKLSNKLNIKSDNFIDIYTLKRYHNEVYNVSNRTVRSNLENKAVYFLSPFAESRISSKAYEAIPYLGNSLSFQSEMIKKINPKLSQIESDYGFNFYNGENYKSILSGYIKEAIPKKIFFNLYHQIKQNRRNSFYQNYLNQFEFMKELNSLIENINLDINLNQLKNNKDTGWLLISLAYLLRYFKNKIQI